MSFKNSSAVVKSEKDLPLETLGNNFDIPSGKCTCDEKITCSFCCIQEYKKAWSDLRKTYHDKNTLFNSDFIQKQEIPDCQDGKKVTDTQCNDKLNLKPMTNHMDSDCNSCSPEKTKDEPVSRTLEQSDKSCDIKTSSTDCSVKQNLIERINTEPGTDSVIHNFKRTRRCVKRKRDMEDSCPICGLTLRISELENHFAKEVENLSKITKNLRKLPLWDKGVNNTYVQVKCNRENRLSAKVAKYAKKSVSQVNCPVCCLKLTGSQDEINEHVLNCSTEDCESDVDILQRDDDSFEEYVIGSETRVRAISLVPGGYGALHGHSSKSKSSCDNDEDLNVDVDDTLTYGKPQYTELDVIHNISETNTTELERLQQLRKSVLTDPTAEPNVLESRKWSDTFERKTEEDRKNDYLGNADECNKSECTENKDKPGDTTQDVIISSLKERIKNLEQHNSVKCLICLEPYTKPVVSTTCWHVHCEECWLMTMGVKKLCPQCNLIVCPSDLRRIYL